MTTARITLGVWIYNCDSDEYSDYDVFRDALETADGSKSRYTEPDTVRHDALVTLLKWFLDSYIKDEATDYRERYAATIAPHIVTFDPSPSAVKWTMTANHDLGVDVYRGIEVEGTVSFDLPVPEGLSAEIFEKEFLAAFNSFSNSYVEWGWMDDGYVFDVVGTAVIPKALAVPKQIYDSCYWCFSKMVKNGEPICLSCGCPVITDPANARYEKIDYIFDPITEKFKRSSKDSFVHTVKWYLTLNETLCGKPSRAAIVHATFEYIADHIVMLKRKQFDKFRTVVLDKLDACQEDLEMYGKERFDRYAPIIRAVRS